MSSKQFIMSQDLRTNVDQLNQMVLQGKILDAFDKFKPARSYKKSSMFDAYIPLSVF